VTVRPACETAAKLRGCASCVALKIQGKLWLCDMRLSGFMSGLALWTAGRASVSSFQFVVYELYQLKYAQQFEEKGTVDT
jgi:hypothetical protein